MSDKTKIILIYTSVAVVSSLLIFGFVTLRQLEDMKAEAERPLAVNIGKDTIDEFHQLQNNITLTNQLGEEVSVFDLKDKVWVFAQFFAKCPMCAERNYTDLLSIYKQYKDHPDFMLVCMTIDPETDDVVKLQEYAEVVKADPRNWWFLTGEKEALHHYMRHEIRYMDVRERTVPEEIATMGRYAHDLGIAVFDKGLKMRIKRDLAFGRSQNDELAAKFEEELHSAIQTALKGGK